MARDKETERARFESSDPPQGVYDEDAAKNRAERFGLRITRRGEPYDHTEATEAIDAVLTGGESTTGDYIPGIIDDIAEKREELGIAEPITALEAYPNPSQVMDVVVRARREASRQTVQANQHRLPERSIESQTEENLMNLMYPDESPDEDISDGERATPEETARLERELEQAYGKDDDRGLAGYYPADRAVGVDAAGNTVYRSEDTGEEYILVDKDDEDE
jgi:hypothetical protein